MDISASQTTDRWIREYLPNIRKDKRHKLTSHPTWDYNCVGLVVGDYRWWHPEDRRSHFWPPNVKRDHWVKDYVAALATVGFSQCKSSTFVNGFQIAAVFHSGGAFKHVATQIAPNLWKSKLGEYEDIEHSLESMEGKGYGKLSTFLVRPFPSGYENFPAEYSV